MCPLACTNNARDDRVRRDDDAPIKFIAQITEIFAVNIANFWQNYVIGDNETIQVFLDNDTREWDNCRIRNNQSRVVCE